VYTTREVGEVGFSYLDRKSCRFARAVLIARLNPHHRSVAMIWLDHLLF